MTDNEILRSGDIRNALAVYEEARLEYLRADLMADRYSAARVQEEAVKACEWAVEVLGYDPCL